MKKIVITGGGTGGHVFPALTMAEYFREKGYQPLYVGSAKGFESKLVPQKNIPLFFISSGAIKNQNFSKKIKSIFQILTSLFSAIAFLLREKPVAVIGVGGYVSVPISIAAFLLRIPLFLQEQNVSVGIANRFLGKLASRVFLGFDQATRYFDPKKVLVSGNPIRAEMLNTERFSRYPETLSILVFGGSQGAKVINDTFLKVLPSLLQQTRQLKIFHQTGERDFLETKKKVQNLNLSFPYEVVPFIENMAKAYEESSFVICRSGALTVSELLAVRRPSILVPFPRKGQNDQVDNAYHLEKLGVAKVVEQGENFEARLEAAVLSFIEPGRLPRMLTSYSGLPLSQASTRIFETIESCITR